MVPGSILGTLLRPNDAMKPYHRTRRLEAGHAGPDAKKAGGTRRPRGINAVRHAAPVVPVVLLLLHTSPVHVLFITPGNTKPQLVSTLSVYEHGGPRLCRLQGFPHMDSFVAVHQIQHRPPHIAFSALHLNHAAYSCSCISFPCSPSVCHSRVSVHTVSASRVFFF